MTENIIPIDDPSLDTEIVSPDLFDQTLNQVLLTPVQLSKDDRYSVRLYDVIGHNITKDLVSYIAHEENISFTSALTTTLIHGWAIMSHEHSDVFSRLVSLRNESLRNNFEMFIHVRSGFSISPHFCNETFIGFIDEKMHDDICIKSDLIKVSNAKYATICLCMSLMDCNYVLPQYQAILKKTVDHFNYNCNILLNVLSDLRY